MSSDNQDEMDLLDIAKIAAREAGKYLIHSKNELKQVLEYKEHDISIVADKESDRLIIEILNSKTDFSILSEESGLVKKPESQYSWIIDPLDGSVNYHCDIPFCAVSIGLWKENDPILGVVYDFNRDELYSGMVEEKKAFRNGDKISVNNKKKKQDSILCTGVPVNDHLSNQRIYELFLDFKSYKKVRFFGSASLSLCYIACGKADVYSENHIQLWDIGAGIPIVIAAGGKVDYARSEKKEYTYNVRATNFTL